MSSNMEHLADILKRAQTARRQTIPEEPRPSVCPRCQGAGYLRHDVPVDDPRFGELIVCDCTRQEINLKRQRFLLDKSQLADLQHYTFDAWRQKTVEGATPIADSPDAAYGVATRYAVDPNSTGFPWLFFYGPTGTGKTHLAAAIGNARIARGQPAIFMVVPDLLGHLRATFSPNSETTYDELFESLKNTPLLILDDLGTQTASPWAREKLYQLINHRYNARLPTVITMNEHGEEIDPRLWSRINDRHISMTCHVKGSDNRLDGVRAPRPPESAPSRSKQTGRPRLRHDSDLRQS